MSPSVSNVVRLAPVAALLALAALASPPEALAQPVTVRIDTPDFGIRIGQPWPRYAPPVVVAPPPVVYAPVVVPPVVVAPVVVPPVVVSRPVPPPVFYPPVVYAPPPRVVYAPVIVPAPRGRGRGHWKHDDWKEERYDRRVGRVIYAPY